MVQHLKSSEICHCIKFQIGTIALWLELHRERSELHTPKKLCGFSGKYKVIFWFSLKMLFFFKLRVLQVNFRTNNIMTNASWTYHPAIVTQKNVIRIVSNRTDATLYRTYVTQTSTTNIIFSLGIFFPSQVPLLLIDATFPRKFLKML